MISKFLVTKFKYIFSVEIPFNFTLPKEGDLIGPAVVATPPLVNQLKQTPRHSTPIGEFCEKNIRDFVNKCNLLMIKKKMM